MLHGKIVDLKRFAVHDGDGIRTTVFMKGCPLRCKWCHNPESLRGVPELAYLAHKCVQCGACAVSCPTGAHQLTADGHLFDRSKCKACGACVDGCMGSALLFYGREMTVAELAPILLEDRDFYENSNGGVTVSGGEPLMQSEFVAELLAQMKANGIHTAVDTCGFVPWANIERVLPVTDIFLYDMKSLDAERHIFCTGQSNELILANLRRICDAGKPVEIRIPFVPTYNDDQIDGIGQFLSTLSGITKVRVLPYHNFAGSKYESLGLENTLPMVELPSKAQIDAAVAVLKGYGLNAMNGND